MRPSMPLLGQYNNRAGTIEMYMFCADIYVYKRYCVYVAVG